jgi:hypothetical protein
MYPQAPVTSTFMREKFVDPRAGREWFFAHGPKGLSPDS